VETLSEWQGRGLLGKPDTRQRGTEFNLVTAQKVVLMARLVAAGVHPVAAGHVVSGHSPKDLGPLVAEVPGGIEIRINRLDLVAC
jgi:hypothetical protein